MIMISYANENIKFSGTLSLIVLPGDTLYSISKKYNISIADILNFNPSIKGNKLNIGQSIILPKKSNKVKKNKNFRILYLADSSDSKININALQIFNYKQDTMLTSLDKLNKNDNLDYFGSYKINSEDDINHPFFKDYKRYNLEETLKISWLQNSISIALNKDNLYK